MEKIESRIFPKNERLRETKVVDERGEPVLMYSRSNTDFGEYQLGKRNLENKTGVNNIGFFFSNRNDLEHYGTFIKERYLDIKNPFDIRDLGAITTYKDFRQKLSELGLSDKDLAGYDLQVQETNIARNKKLGSIDGLRTPSGDGMSSARKATFNFFDAGEGEYLRTLLESRGYDGIIFTDEGDLTAIVFHSEQIIKPEQE